MVSRLVVVPEDRAWFARTTFRDARETLRFEPHQIAAISQSSETFAVTVKDIAGDDRVDPAPTDGSRASHPALVFVKRYRYRTFLGRLQGMFRGTLFGKSRARFEFERLRAIRERGVAAVRPIAYAEFRRRGFMRACVLITEAERDAVSLDRLLRPPPRERAPQRGTQRRLAEQLAAFVARMHDAGVMHGALLGRNLLVAEVESASPRFVVLDPNPHGTVSNTSISDAGRVSDLTDLAATALAVTTRTVRARFFHAYQTHFRMRRGVADTGEASSAGGNPRGLTLDALRKGRAPAARSGKTGGDPRRRRFNGADRTMIAEIERRAVPLAKVEEHRQTIAAATAWLQERVRRQRSAAEGAMAAFDSLDAFLAAAEGAVVNPDLPTCGIESVILLQIRDFSRDGQRSTRSVELEVRDGRVGVRVPERTGGGASFPQSGRSDDSSTPRAALRIDCDEATFLAAINGDASALEHARRGRIEVRGDTRLLEVLGEIVRTPMATQA